MKQERTKTIYYNEHGQIDIFTTYINNNAWVMPTVLIIMIILCGIVEGLQL